MLVQPVKEPEKNRHWIEEPPNTGGINIARTLPQLVYLSSTGSNQRWVQTWLQLPVLVLVIKTQAGTTFGFQNRDLGFF
jgi:hypothetical protein